MAAPLCLTLPQAINISLADEENAIRMAMKTRATRTLSILSSAFLAQQHFSMHRGLIVTLVQAGEPRPIRTSAPPVPLAYPRFCTAGTSGPTWRASRASPCRVPPPPLAQAPCWLPRW